MPTPEPPQEPNEADQIPISEEIQEVLEKINIPVNEAQAPVKSDSDVTGGEQKFLQDELIQDLQQARAQRKEYAVKIYNLIVFWLLGVAVMLAACAFNREFRMSDTVVLAVIGGTTINVLGLFAIVVWHLFPRGGITHK